MLSNCPNVNIELVLEQYLSLYYNKYKERLVILQSIGIIAIKVKKQGQSPTPADILVDI